MNVSLCNVPKSDLGQRVCMCVCVSMLMTDLGTVIKVKNDNRTEQIIYVSINKVNDKLIACNTGFTHSSRILNLNLHCITMSCDDVINHESGINRLESCLPGILSFIHYVL